MRDRLTALLHRIRPHHVQIGTAVLWVPPGVLDPVLFRSGVWFAQHMARQVRPGQRLLDVGCGSGVVGVLAQRQGARVTAVDIHPPALQAAKRNGIADVRHSDLLQALPQERFSHICFNPPYFPGAPTKHGYDLALFGGKKLDVMKRFLDATPQALRADGQGWMVLSDRAPQALHLSESAGWTMVKVENQQGELLSIWRTP